MTKIEFHTEAQSELEEAHAWYRERSEFAARAFAAEIDYVNKKYIEVTGRLASNSVQ
jgi:hypothetical protein